MSIENTLLSNNSNATPFLDIECLWSFESEEETGEVIRKLVKQLVREGQPAYDLKRELSFRASLEAKLGKDSLRFLCILEAANLLIEGKACIHDISYWPAEDVAALAIEEEANRQLKETYPAPLVDAFENKFPYIPRVGLTWPNFAEDGLAKVDGPVIRGKTWDGDNAIAFYLRTIEFDDVERDVFGVEKPCYVAVQTNLYLSPDPFLVSNYPEILHRKRTWFPNPQLPPKLLRIIQSDLLGKSMPEPPMLNEEDLAEMFGFTTFLRTRWT